MQLNTKQVAELFRVTERTIANWIKEGLPVVRGVGRAGNTYQGWEVVEWYVGKRFADKIGDEGYDYMAERARLTHHQANIAELEAEQRRGNLWPTETVGLMLQRIIGNGRAKLLSIPSKVRNRVPGLEPRAYDLIEDLIREAMDELSADRIPDDVRESLERYHSHLAATAEDEPEPVGDSARRDH